MLTSVEIESTFDKFYKNIVHEKKEINYLDNPQNSFQVY